MTSRIDRSTKGLGHRSVTEGGGWLEKVKIGWCHLCTATKENGTYISYYLSYPIKYVYFSKMKFEFLVSTINTFLVKT